MERALTIPTPTILDDALIDSERDAPNDDARQKPRVVIPDS